MCNACGFLCCGSDEFSECGCDHCDEPDCHTAACFKCGSRLCDGDCDEWEDVEAAEAEYRAITAEPDDPYDTARDSRRDDRDIHGI